MKLSVDLHMHSCLSACANDDMTPNNMANMAYIKGLDIIALTDHNSYFNTLAFNEICKNNNILPINGCEVTSVEEIHIVTLFKTYEALEKFGKLVYLSLMDVENKPQIFGNQYVLNTEDELIREEKKLLIGATTLTVDDIFSITLSLDGIAIPAHVDRNSYSMLTSFGTIPKELPINILELSKHITINDFKNKHKELNGYRYYNSSDAHYLEDIFEKECNVMELEDKSIDCLFEYLKRKD